MRDRNTFYLAVCALSFVACSKSRPSDQTVNMQVQACGFGAGMAPADTIAGEHPTGNDIPIEHIILIMQENRSFDHYFSNLPISGLDTASPTATNPDSKGNQIQRYHFTSKCMPGGDHGWDPQHANLDGGKMDGFVISNKDSTVPMGYYDGTDLPFYYALSQTFAISDAHFCSVLGPTWPNRMFYFAGTSWGFTDNNFPPTNDPAGNVYPNIFSEMDDANVPWRVYYQDYPTPNIVDLATYIDDVQKFIKSPDIGTDVSTSPFAADVAAGNLAAVTYVEASDLLGNKSPDEGPPGDVDIGQNFTSGVIDTIMNSPFWKSSVIFLTYDENGGMYDHVVPPAACAPDNLPDNNGSSVGFTQYGFRVPFIVISPYAKRGYVSHIPTDHTAILRFVEAKFNLKAMTARDANAQPPYDMFDFDHPDFSVPSLPAVTVDQAALAACGS